MEAFDPGLLSSEADPSTGSSRAFVDPLKSVNIGEKISSSPRFSSGGTACSVLCSRERTV